MSDAKHSEDYEAEHVHQVYERIAEHFSSTRFKAWPIVERFLLDLPDGAIGLDVGCGNGKYLTVNKNVFIIGSDRSTNLCHIARQHQPHSVVVADVLDLPHANGQFDFTISIAVVHHLSTDSRRQEAIKALLACLAPQGRALIYVWALEQESSRRGWTENDSQDVMVPWVLKKPRKDNDGTTKTDEVFQRYYHLYRKGELERDIATAGGVVLDSGYEKDNWWAIAGLAVDRRSLFLPEPCVYPR